MGVPAQEGRGGRKGLAGGVQHSGLAERRRRRSPGLGWGVCVGWGTAGSSSHPPCEPSVPGQGENLAPQSCLVGPTAYVCVLHVPVGEGQPGDPGTRAWLV